MCVLLKTKTKHPISPPKSKRQQVHLTRPVFQESALIAVRDIISISLFVDEIPNSPLWYFAED